MSDIEELAFSQYLPALQRLSDAGVDLILVAGQAVNFWAEYYKKQEIELSGFLPFTSKDVDLLGSIEDLYNIPKILDGELKRYSDVRQPLVGVFTSNSVPPLKFDLLRSVYGLVGCDKIESRSKVIGAIKVIDPLSLLAAKCHNASGLDQKHRQDVRQIQMMTLVTNAFVSDIITEVGGRLTPRQFINEIKYFLMLAADRQFQKGLAMAKRNISECLPLGELNNMGSEFPAIKRFIENTLQPSLDSLTEK